MNRLKRLWKMYFSEEGNLLTYALAFSILLTLAPSLLIFVLLLAYAYIDFKLIEDILLSFLPYDSSSQFQLIVDYFIHREYSWMSFISTMSASFYLASKSIYSFLLISSQNEKVELPKWYLRIRSIWIYVNLVLFVVFILYLFYPWILAYFWLRIIALWLCFYLLYQSLCFRQNTWYYGFKGALFACIAFSLLATLFVHVIQYFTSYQVIYGPLASVVTLILLIYLISSIIYIGFCLNVVWQKEDIEKLPLRNMVLYHRLRRLKIFLYQNLRKRNEDEDRY